MTSIRCSTIQIHYTTPNPIVNFIFWIFLLPFRKTLPANDFGPEKNRPKIVFLPRFYGFDLSFLPFWLNFSRGSTTITSARRGFLVRFFGHGN